MTGEMVPVHPVQSCGQQHTRWQPFQVDHRRIGDRYGSGMLPLVEIEGRLSTEHMFANVQDR
jgi:hypothetical protein